MNRLLILAGTLGLSLALVAGCAADKTAAAPKLDTGGPLVGGQDITISGQIDVAAGSAVTLQVLDKDKWKKVADDKAASQGRYEFTVEADQKVDKYRVVAGSGSEKVTSAVLDAHVKRDRVTIGIYRQGKQTWATGRAKPIIKGRTYQLQALAGKDWKDVGDPLNMDDDGVIKTRFDLGSGKKFRFVGESVAGSDPIESIAVPFAMGPGKLGDSVIYLTTETGEFPEIKNEKFEARAVVVDGDDVTYPLDLDELEVRGNSTADKVKHPYRLEFDSKQKLFGLPKSKNWILLANYGDRTLVRTALASEFGAALDGLEWQPRRHFTELYVNGRYDGSYELIESIQIAKKRLNLSEKAGVVIEIDPHFAIDGRPGFFGKDYQPKDCYVRKRTVIRNGVSKQQILPCARLPYVFKEPDKRKFDDAGREDPEGFTNDKFTTMRKRILDFEKVLWSDDFDDPEKGWQSYIDLDSAVDYYLVKELTKENDGDGYRSNYFYVHDYADPDSKFFIGPAWDFDRSAGAKPPPDATNSGTRAALPTGWWLRGQGSPNHRTTKTHWFARLSKDPAFIKAVEKRWAEKRDEIRKIAYDGADAAVKDLGPAPESDRQRWPSNSQRYPANAATYAGEIDVLKAWYRARFDWMDSQLR